MSEIRNYDISEVTNRDFALKKDEFKKRFNEIINKPLTIDNIDSFADDALNELIVLIGEIKEEYENRHLIEEGQQIDQNTLESLACVEYGLPETSPILDLITKKVSQLEQIDDFINNNIIQRNEVIVPPDQISPEFGNGEGREKKDPSIIPRLKTLLYILEADFSLDLKELTLTQGQNTKEMVRKLSYVTVEAPEINRVVQVCDEEGNASYIFDLAEMEKHGISVEDLNQTTKEEKNELIRQYTGLGIRVVQNPKWRFVVSEYLSEKIPEREAKDKGYFFKPEISKEIDQEVGSIPQVSRSEVDPWRGFWTDEEGNHWGPIRRMALILAISEPKIVKTIERFSLDSMKILDTEGRPLNSYCFESLQELLGDYLSLPQVEKSGEWEGFYVDEEGSQWGSLSGLARYLGVDRGTIINKIKLHSLASLQILDNRRVKISAYKLEEVRSTLKDHLPLPDVEKSGEWEGFYVDEEGSQWGSILKIAEKLGVSRKIISDQIKNTSIARTIKVKNNLGRPIEAYSVEDIKIILDKYLSLPRVEKSGEWEQFSIDQNGDHWGAVESIAKKLKVSSSLIKKSLRNFSHSQKSLIDKGGRLVESYCLEDIEKKLDDYLSLSQVETEGEWRGFWTDEEGNHWGPIGAIAYKLNLTHQFCKSNLEKLNPAFLNLKDSGGHKVVGYNFEELQEQIKEYLTLPQVETEGEWRGFWTDEEGNHWGGVKVIANRLGVGRAIRIKEANLFYKRVKDLNGKLIEAYCIEDIEKHLNP